MIRVFLADDHPLMRAGVEAALAADGGFEIVGSSGDGLRIADLVERLCPNVLVLDVMLPGLNGIEICRKVTRCSPATRVLMLSMHANEAYVLEALRAGALGYALKDTAADELARAVHAVASGRRYLSSPFSDHAVEAYASRLSELTDPYETLTERERGVLQLAAEGHSNAEIGKRLFISSRTVEIHKANMLRKLNITAAEMTRYALRRGLITLDG